MRKNKSHTTGQIYIDKCASNTCNSFSFLQGKVYAILSQSISNQQSFHLPLKLAMVFRICTAQEQQPETRFRSAAPVTRARIPDLFTL